MRIVCLCIYYFFIFSGTEAQGQVFLINENFNGASIPAGWAKINNSAGGNVAAAEWTLRPDAYTYSSLYVRTPETFHSNDNTQFYLSNSDAQEDITQTILQSPAFSTIGYPFITLKFYHYFREYTIDSGFVEISTNGANWNIAATYTFPPNFREGSSSSFVQKTVDLSAFAGNPIVYVRFRYYADFGYFWAIDNVSISGSATGICSINNWDGTVSTAWENPLNWSCGTVPGSNTVVNINTGKSNYPVINSMATCKSITVGTGTSVLIVTGFKLDITGQ